MRLFMTTDSVGGVWTYAVTLAASLRRQGVSTTLAVLGPPPRADQRAAALAISGLDLREVPGELDWLAADAAALRPVARALGELARGADIVQLNSPALAAWGDFDRPVVGTCHSCLASWWQAAGEGPMPDSFVWRGTLLAQGYAACDRLVAPSASFAATIAALYGRSLEVVHNGIAWTSPDEDTPRQCCVLTAGRLWDAGKGFATLDDAAARLSAPLLAAGPAEGPGGARIAVRHAMMLGTLTPAALRRRMRQTGIFASAARYEPFGLAVLEAAQSGCALVLADIPSFRELWQGACRFVPPGDPMAWSAALQALLDDPGETARLGRAAAAHAARYSDTAMAAAMLGLYRGLSARHRGAA